MADKHTPVPWTQMGDEIYGADGTRIAAAVTMRDVLLLTAAPELLEELQGALQALEAYGFTQQAGKARAAIAKATGQEVSHG